MDQESENNTLGLALNLDEQSSISCLNPFDRPPNIMDDEMNSVTQEELEANLSTDCPASSAADNAPTSWEQLIQSVFREDTSTQDAELEQQDISEQVISQTIQTEEEVPQQEDTFQQEDQHIEALEMFKKEINEEIESGLMDWCPEQQNLRNVDLDENESKDDQHAEGQELHEENIRDNEDEKTMPSVDEELSPKDEISIHSTAILTQEEDVFQCYYDDTINEEDIHNDLCQVEVYATDDLKERDGKSPTNMDINETQIKDEELDETDELLSDASSVSIGHIEEAIKNDDNQEEKKSVSQLSIINSDHCYSQEKITPKERDTLKQKLMNYVIQQCLTKDHEKICNLVNKLFHGLDNNKADMIFESIEKQETPEDDTSIHTEQKEYQDTSENEVQEIKNINEENSTIEEEKQETTEEIKNPINDENVSEFDKETKQESTAEESEINHSINEENESIRESLLDENNIMADEKGNENKTEEEEDNKNHDVADTDAKTGLSLEEITPSSENIIANSKKEMVESKPLTEIFADNCSEPLEHHMFEEEFAILCKNGNIALEKAKHDQSSDLLSKLIDFAAHIQRDCNSFYSASTNIEQKLHDYIQQQYKYFQEQFKAYCQDQKSRIAVETQTDFKKVTKRHRNKLNLDSKKCLMKTSDKSSQYDSSSSSLSGDEDSKTVIFESHRKKRATKRSLKSTTTLDNEGNNERDGSSQSHHPITHFQEYDDGIDLSKYVQSEIFEIESQHSSVLSSVEDSASGKEEDGEVPNNYIQDDGDDSDTAIFFKPKRDKKISSEDGTPLSATDSKRSRKNRADEASVNSESDKENQISKRLERKSMDEEEKTEKEIERLINIGGLVKRSVANAGSSTKSSDKSKAKSYIAKNTDNRFDFMDVEFGSDDDVKSEAEEEVITEKQFLERCNEDIKRQMLDESSTDSEELDDEDDELLKVESEEDEESGKNSPLVDKFLKTFVVDDSDNDVVDEDDDLDLDSDKEIADGGVAALTKEDNSDDQPADLSLKEKEGEETAKISDTLNDMEGETHSASEMELLNDNLLFRKRGGNRNQKLDKMLSDAEKRKRISKIDEELISLSSESENSDVEEIGLDSNQSAKPRAIKPMLRPDQLAGETIKAQKHENERISRLEKKHNMLDKVIKEQTELDKNKDLILDYIKDTKTFIKVHPAIVKYLKPHQFDGVRFMYDSCYGGVDALKKSPGSGCILAHCMGLGKTLQLIALLHTVISYKELKTTKVLVLCPKSTVMNWADEIIRWLGPLRQKNLKVYTFNDTSDITEKLSILKEWSQSNHTRAGCLLIGYEAFRTLVFYHSYKNRGNISAHRLEEIRKNVNTYLLQPGADLVICDEGHIIKNSKSAISMAVAQIVTPRRIVLTGTPIQNNLKEYYSMVNFIKPLFLGTEKEFANLYANPIKNGQHKDSGKTDIKIMKQRSFVLHKKLSKFVQRKEAELLKTFLPQKFEYVLFIPMTDVQNNLYQHILNAITNRDETYRGKGLITDYTCLRKIWTHPKVLEDAWKNAVNQRNRKEVRQKQKDHNSDDDQPDDIYDSQTGQMSVTNDWWRSLLTEKDLESIMPSNKLRTMFKILQMCEEKGEKCLIFSAFVAVLNVVEYFFRKITDNDETIRKELNINNPTKWELGHDYYRLDGKTPKSMRHAMINEFNNVLNKQARVFLISAKAGGQGINLIGANRVIILDTSWNPSNDQQNIFRVFRLGQKRNCYIYRLLAMGTMEEKVYSRSVTKQAMSFRVVDEQQIDRHYNMAELAELYILTIPDKNNRPTPILPQDSVLARLLRSFPDLVYKYHEHDSLLENKVEQELSEQEKNEAWTAYERDLQMNSEMNEKPNIEDFQNKFNPPIPNYMSPFSGIDISSFFGNRGFNQPLLQSLLGPNSTPSTAQQYLDMFNYYKNLSTYSDLNSYSALSAMGAGRMPVGPSTSSASNPLAALGDLSMYGLSSSALQSLGASSAANSMSLANSVLAGALPPMPVASSAPSPMYTSPAPSSISNVSLSSAGLTNTTSAAAALNTFEQYQQSLRNSFPNMYSYAGDFGIGSSGSTILDKSKSGKNTKHSSGGSSNKNPTNLPGGSKTGINTMGLFPGSSMYLPQQQQQQQQQSRPSSRNTPNEVSNKSKAPTPAPSNSLPSSTPNTTSTTNLTTTANASLMSTSSQNVTNASKTNTNGSSSSLINYRRSESTSSNSSTTKSVAQSSNPKMPTQKRSNVEPSSNDNVNNRATSASSSNNSSSSKQFPPKGVSSANTLQQSPHQQQQSQSSKSTPSSISLIRQNSPNPKPSPKPSSNNSGTKVPSNPDNSRTTNMGILYPNSKGQEKPSGTKPNSPMNMGIVYPRSSTKNTSSEMQIIPTSSPPGTTSISKQLNDLSPSISLTAVKNSSGSQKASKSNSASQNIQLNKVLQNNTTIRRTISPVTITGVNSSKSSSSGNSNANSASSTSNPSNLLARFKAASNKMSSNNGNNNTPPPLHRANTSLGITKGSAINVTPKSTPGLTITNIKPPMKTSQNLPNKATNVSSSSTLVAKQQAAASVAKSNIQRAPSSTSGVNSSPITTSSSSNLQRSSTSASLPSVSSIKRTIIKRMPTNTPNTVPNNKMPATLSSPSVTVTSSNKLPIISSVKSISPSMATISKNISKGNSSGNAQSKPTINTVSNISRTLTNAAAASSSRNMSSTVRNAVNIRPVDNKQNSSNIGGGVYIIETNINDKKVAIGTPTKSGGGTTVTKVPQQNPNKRKSTDPSSKESAIENKRIKN
ncbi:uncharacterized protein LOC142224305 isoform X2 [Haematobia irritans]|uniref:uncharacterized protein LOC142224305 isoform X2 n=1 Tax=Haematobia irritans TaxID=7368 RepID=UPI003F50A6F4